MPIEREVKFLMQRSATRSWLLQKPSLIPGPSRIIQQVYLGDARLRAIETLGEEGVRYRFTWKRKTPSGRAEIECDIEATDFEALLPTADRSLTKRRDVFLHAATGLDIELDTFFDETTGESYLTMIEIEHGADQIALVDEIVPTIASRMRERIEPDDQRFENYRLANKRYARDLIAALGDDPNSITLAA